MATITPFVKRMRTQGGTIFTFSSALEDIGLNINERNNVVKMSHYALLNIPSIDAPPENSQENRFNVLGIAGAYQSFLNSGSIKDGRVIVAESFQNYALNLETNLLAQPTYNPALSATVSERVFWKWLKETGAIRWQPIDTSIGTYWQEENDTDSSTAYNSIVKAIGQISAGSVRTDTFGTYNETYVLVPTSFGQTPVYFKQVEDDNYKHGMHITGGLTNILGRNPYLKPHPDGLDIQAYYDLPDSSTIVGPTPYTMQYDDSTGSWTNGWWYTSDGFNLSDDRDYFIDTDAYKTSKIYNISLQYLEPGIGFKRSKVDCLSIEYNLNNLKTIFQDNALTFDKLAIQDAIDDSYQFNAILLYYSIYNQALDNVLATNLLGILFLDPPSGNTQSYPLNEIVLPSITKLQSGPNGFGTSYSFRLNIKSDYMLDDTQAIVTDTTASQQVLTDFSQVFDSLGKTLGILNQQTGTINYITEQYLDLSSQQTSILNQMNTLQQQVNNLDVGIKGTENAITMFASGNDPLIDSSIYMKNGNIGFFNTNPAFPVQIDASLKVKDIYIENAIRDTNGNILLGYGSPQQLGSSTNFRELDIYTGNSTPAIHIDTNNNVFINNIPTSSYIPETSLGTTFVWTAGVLDASLSGGGVGGVTKIYVDGSLAQRDVSILWLQNNILTSAALNPYIKNASLGYGLIWNPGTHLLDVSIVSSGGTGDVTKLYVDGSLAKRDVSIAWLNTNKITLSALNPYATTYAVSQGLLPYATNASINTAGFIKNAALSAYLPKAGGTMSGNLAVNGQLTVSGVSNFNAGIVVGGNAASTFNTHGYNSNGYSFRSGAYLSIGGTSIILNLHIAYGTLRVIATNNLANTAMREYRIGNTWNYPANQEMIGTGSVTRGTVNLIVGSANDGSGGMRITISAPAGYYVKWSFEGLTTDNILGE